MLPKYILVLFGCFLLGHVSGQTPYEVDTRYPVHDLDPVLQVVADTENSLTAKQLLSRDPLPYVQGDQLPKYLEVGVTYWGRLELTPKSSMSGWTLHFEDKMIGPPAWTKSNGKVDVYAYAGGDLIFHRKTGAEYPDSEKDYQGHWVLNAIPLDGLPINTTVTLLIRAVGNSMGYPAYFNLTARSPKQPYYHQIYQFNRSFNVFMFGVTFIIFLYHLLQFIYLRQKIFFWFSLWLLFCTLTQGMSIGFIVGTAAGFRYPLWLMIANGIFYTFWFFGRAFVDSKNKFPKLDKAMLGLALFILVESAVMTIYVLAAKPQIYFTGVSLHYSILNVYTLVSLTLSIILVLKKDLFARYFGFGSIIASLALVVGTIWSMGFMLPPLGLDPYPTGMFLQIVIYSFGIAYRQKHLDDKAQNERILAEQSRIEMQRIKDLDQLKTRFFTNISHEFRTPLTLIRGPIDEARRNGSTKDANREITMSPMAFGIVERNAKRLESLVDELLELSKIESGKVALSLEESDIIMFVKSVVFAFESMAERRGITFKTTFEAIDNKGYFDRSKLEKIVYNLLSNAFKFTGDGGTVSVDVRHEAQLLTIRISDTGKGIEAHDLPNIFDRFYRVEGTEEKGSGIGLALCKELVDVLQGQITADSVRGEGTTFQVILPTSLDRLPGEYTLITKGAQLSDPQLLSVPSDDSGDDADVVGKRHAPVILVVEDNADLRTYIEDILKREYNVVMAEDGVEGVAMALEHIPDIVVSDVMMPKKNGYELCHTLKNNERTSHIPVVLLTAKADHSHKMEGLEQGADAYLTKPFDAMELRVRLQNQINAKKRLWERFRPSDGVLVEDLDMNSIDDAFLQKVLKTIGEHLDDESLSVEMLARAVGFSRAQLHRKLKALLDKSPNQLINEVRLNKARALLMHNTGSVSEIAYSVGFSNMSYFTKRFKEKFHITPSELREQRGNTTG